MANFTIDNRVKLHRVLRAPAERVYRAFIDSQAKCKWLPPHGYIGELRYNDPRIGGSYGMSFTSFRTGESHAFSGVYVELTPYKSIRYTDTFDDPNMPGEMDVSITLHEVSCGTDLTIVQENLPPQIPADLCYLGWQESLLQLASLVEPEI